VIHKMLEKPRANRQTGTQSLHILSDSYMT